MRRAILLSLFALTTLSAAVKIDKIAYKGWPNCYRISNGDVELIVTADVGPRIIRYGFPGGQNLFVEFPEESGQTGGEKFRLYGGHRLWIAPEDIVRSYGPDNRSVDVKVDGDVLTATAPVEKETGVQKTIQVRLAASGSEVEVRHRLTNKTIWTLEMSPWTLSMMAPGGTGVASFPPRGKHPEVLAPTNPIVMFAFTNLSDPRWKLLEKYVALKQDPGQPDPEKIGLFNPKTRAAYLLGNELFVKKYDAIAGGTYTDMQSSFEIFTNDRFLELETLGPLAKLPPDGFTEHVERWSLHKNVQIREWTDVELDRVLIPLFQ